MVSQDRTAWVTEMYKSVHVCHGMVLSGSLRCTSLLACRGIGLSGSLRCTSLLMMSWDGAVWVTEMYKYPHDVMGWGCLGH